MFVAFLRLLCLLVGLLPGAFAQEDPFRVEVADATVAPGKAGTVTITVVVPAGFHVYRDMMGVTTLDAAGLTVGDASFPKGLVRPDPANPAQTREQYDQDVLIDVPVAVAAGAKAGVRTVAFDVHYQGCKKNLCYFPGKQEVEARVTVPAAKGELSIPGISRAWAEGPADEVDTIFTAKAGPPNTATIHVDLQGDWHINKAFVAFSLPEPGGYTLGEPVLPPGEQTGKAEDFSLREDYVHDLDLVVPITGPTGEGKVKVELAYQACKGVSICKMPTSTIVEVPVVIDPGAPTGGASVTPAPEAAPEAAPKAAPAPEAAPAAAPPAAPGTSGFAAAAEQGTAALVLLCFLAGIGVSFTPCVLPMVPITMGLIGARTAGSRPMAIALSATYMLGMAVVYTVLGLFAGVTGALFGSWLQSTWVVGGIATFFVIMGAAMFGMFDVGVPSAIASRISGRGGGGGFGGALVLGVIGAILAGPCSGPVVAAILALIGREGQVGLGALLMFAFSTGMGMIFLVTGAASGWLPSRGPWMILVKKAFGIVMWLGAIYYVAPHLSTNVTALVTAAVLLSTAVFSWPHPDDGEGYFLERLRQVYAIVGVLVGAYLLVGTLVREGFILPAFEGVAAAGTSAQKPAIAWLSDEETGLARARAEGKPLMIDFTAEWCAACHEMEKYTYTDPAVIAAAQGFVPVMIDCTQKADPRILEIQKKYGVTGLPTVVFVNPDGAKVGETIGFVEAKDFLPHMKAASGAG